MTATPDRRTVLKGVGAAAVAAGTGAALTACEGDEKPTEAPTSAAPPVTVAKDRVPVGGGVVLDQRFVVTQPEAGTFKAFTKVCPHQRCAVSFVKNRQIVCACHSSEFSITDGARTSGPAKTGLKEYPVAVDGNDLTIG